MTWYYRLDAQDRITAAMNSDGATTGWVPGPSPPSDLADGNILDGYGNAKYRLVAGVISQANTQPTQDQIDAVRIETQLEQIRLYGLAGFETSATLFDMIAKQLGVARPAILQAMLDKLHKVDSTWNGPT